MVWSNLVNYLHTSNAYVWTEICQCFKFAKLEKSMHEYKGNWLYFINLVEFDIM